MGPDGLFHGDDAAPQNARRPPLSLSLSFFVYVSGVSTWPIVLEISIIPSRAHQPRGTVDGKKLPPRRDFDWHLTRRSLRRCIIGLLAVENLFPSVLRSKFQRN